ncbi:geranylgeranylglycerol-phosphate geranylgeranyltransferase [Candidatus Amoebophilus asiaticus]|nr:geranylgeranylglycerol-phosphate geranylgeranyltransferase [Candidatus Amoebophilus asiaticus]
MKAFIKLLRVPNLLIIAFTQYVVRFFLDFSTYPEFNLPDFNFFLLSLSTVMIAAAGYIINDYFDIRTDMINRPESVIVGQYVKRRVAMGAHLVINAIAIILGYYVFWRIGHFSFGTIYIISAGLLWFYATTYKRQLIIGNLIISILTAMVVLIVGIYEKQLVTKIILTYSFYAFILTLIREIVKDLEDIKGDKELDCQTLPIVIGINKTKIIICVINFIAILSLTFFQHYFFQNEAYMHLLYITLFIQAPLLYFMWVLYKAKEPQEYHKITGLLKLVMLMGILAIVVFYFI